MKIEQYLDANVTQQNSAFSRAGILLLREVVGPDASRQPGLFLSIIYHFGKFFHVIFEESKSAATCLQHFNVSGCRKLFFRLVRAQTWFKLSRVKII